MVNNVSRIAWNKPDNIKGSSLVLLSLLLPDKCLVTFFVTWDCNLKYASWAGVDVCMRYWCYLPVAIAFVADFLLQQRVY